MLADNPAPEGNPQTLMALLRHRAATRPHELALVDPVGRLTYGELLRRVQSTGRWLRAQGLGRHARVAVACTSSPLAARLFLGTAAHCTCVLVDPGLDGAAAADLLRRTGTATLLHGGTLPCGLEQAARETGIDCVCSDDGFMADARDACADPSPPGIDDLPEPEDDMLVVCSSGTTGRAKLVPRTHAGMLLQTWLPTHALGLSGDRRTVVLVAMHHIMGPGRLLRALLLGGSCTPLGRLYLPEFAHWVREVDATSYTATPVIHEELMHLLDAHPKALQGWKPVCVSTAAAAMKPAVLQRLRERFGASVNSLYGSSEASPIAGCLLSDPALPPGAVGRPVFYETCILDPQGRPVPAGARGEIAVRGPALFHGYLDDDELNARSFVDGWFRTGDLGRLDADGWLHLEGRLDDVINRGGAKVSVKELEDWLVAQPGVKLAAVFAVPHAALGEDVMAAVVAQPGVALDGSTLRTEMLAGLPRYKVPSRVIVVEALPLGPAGKVRREGLADRFHGALGPRYVAPRTPLEASVARWWQQLLDQEAVGVDDDFFELGGHSLRASQLAVRLEAQLAVPCSVVDVFECPTPALLAARLQRRVDSTADGARSGPHRRPPAKAGNNRRTTRAAP